MLAGREEFYAEQWFKPQKEMPEISTYQNAKKEN